MADRLDPRIARTTHALEEAVVRLASQRPVSRITVAELTGEAGVSRATFYNRYSSPLEVLIKVLYADLDEGHRREAQWRAEKNPTADQALRMATGEVADHVVRFAQIYRHTLDDPADRGVYQALVQHFTDYSLAFMSRGANPALPDVNRHIVAQFVSHGFAGAITAWLSDASLSRDDLVDAVVACAPAWWS